MSVMNFLPGAIRSGVLVLLLSAHPISEGFAGQDPAPPETGSFQQFADLPSGLLEKVVSLYPGLGFQRDGTAAFISSVREVARVSLDNGEERLAIWVFVIVPAARVDHGWSEFLVFKDATDVQPIVRRQGHTLPIISFSDVHVIRNRWVQFGDDEILLSLADEEALRHFERQGDGSLILGLSREAASRALAVYVKEGREAFLKVAPIREHRERHVKNLPDRISRFELYPSLVKDARYSFFKYYQSWEATVLVRLRPAGGADQPVVLEMGARGLTAGIEA
ncbi:MAG: hypothetical protein K9G33_15490, partial [Sneathiella sp.]|nr:hypothetical protein [Sneathiella sp.]